MVVERRRFGGCRTVDREGDHLVPPFLGKETPGKHALSILLLTASKYVEINSVFSHKKKKNNNGIICQNESGACYAEPHLLGKDASQSETGQ